MKIEVSTSIAGLLRKTSLDEALECVHASGIRCLDFPLSVFSRPADSPLKSDSWLTWTETLKAKLDSMGFRVTQAHASWEQKIPSDMHFESPFGVYARTIIACRILGCRKLVFHAPLYFQPIVDEDIRAKVDAWNVRWFKELLPVLEENGVAAELENTFDYRHVQRPGDPGFTYTAAEHMLSLVDAIDSPWVKICLDTGHANIAGQDPAQMIHAYGNKLEVLHLNDNFGFIQPVYEDLHLFPGNGNLNWQSIFEALHEEGFQGIFNLEPVGSLPELSLELRTIQFRAARETLKSLARAAGFEDN